jgi:hypothetical protein
MSQLRFCLEKDPTREPMRPREAIGGLVMRGCLANRIGNLGERYTEIPSYHMTLLHV